MRSVFTAIPPFPILSQEILQLTQATIKKVFENYSPMPDWALEAIGATIDKERTSKSYGGQGKKTQWLFPFAFSSANPPETILQEMSGLPEAQLQSLRNSQQMRELKETVAQVSAAIGNILQAVREVLSDHGVQEEKREKALPRTFRYIKFQVHSNWGNPEYTCVYWVQVHGKMASHNNHVQAQELL
ncbi:SUN domain-containing protein 2-like [Grus japonensis]|uniref:SUN domain-containing protein 2-like n=1 Tax=Grus japonensis TaxID=30415 RepID=A0ABC9WT12_GRUJA